VAVEPEKGENIVASEDEVASDVLDDDNDGADG
jgi:hypothetical protein